MTKPRDSDRVVVFDTTLRDGEQSPGASMTLTDKVEIAAALAHLGVDVIEAGFPASSAGDFAAVYAVACQTEGPTIAALSRCQAQDIAKTAMALRDAHKKRIHLFLATSPIHRQHKLRMDRSGVLSAAVTGVALARESFADIEFSAEDAARTEPDFLCEVVERVIEAGATVINIPDTVGYAVPEQYGAIVAHLKRHVRKIAQVTISVHCHDDLGLAVANSLAALKAGARQVECTINGIGERAGNCALEEVVMAMRTRHDFYPLHTGIATRELYSVSQLVNSVIGFAVPRNKAIVGANAFAHEAGIHQHGMLSHHETYEIMRPEDVGQSGDHLVLGKHSGRHALANWLKRRGHRLDNDELANLFASFKTLADQVKSVTDDDLETLVAALITASQPRKQAARTTEHVYL